MTPYAELSESQKSELLYASSNLLKAVTSIWGPEQGMVLWDKIAEGLGDDLKGALFFDIITGNVTKGSVVLVKIDPNYFVAAIKAVRCATGMGLKEAKDLCDIVRAGKEVVIDVIPAARAALIKDLNECGCLVR